MQSRIEDAAQKKKCGKYNCAQAVACAYCDLAGTDEETMRRITQAFGVGMGTLEGNCGALTGAGVVLGMVNNDPRDFTRLRGLRARRRRVFGEAPFSVGP